MDVYAKGRCWSKIRASNKDAERIHIADRIQWRGAKEEEEEEEEEVYAGYLNIECCWMCCFLQVLLC